jgi:hypothetical protein
MVAIMRNLNVNIEKGLKEILSFGELMLLAVDRYGD